MRTMIFALRLIVPGAIMAIAGVAAIFTKEFFDIGWRFAIGGVGLVGVGIYILVRKPETPPESAGGPAIIPENVQIDPNQNPYR